MDPGLESAPNPRGTGVKGALGQDQPGMVPPEPTPAEMETVQMWFATLRGGEVKRGQRARDGSVPSVS